MDGDWQCPNVNCGEMNYLKREKCHICYTYKPSYNSKGTREKKAMREGDWICSNCGKDNFSFREQCFECGEYYKENQPARSYNTGRGQKKVQTSNRTVEGDWICEGCGENNFQFRNKCYKCGEYKTGGGKEKTGYKERTYEKKEQSFKEGDWICKECKKNNFKFRTECFACKCAKPKEE